MALMKKKRIGDLLRERGSINQSELDRALETQRALAYTLGKKVRLGEVLAQSSKSKKKDVAAALQEIQGIEYVDCRNADVSKQARRLIPRDFALKICGLPLEIKDKCLIIVLAEPTNLAVLDDLRFRSGLKISPRFGFREEIIEGIMKAYGREIDDFTANKHR